MRGVDGEQALARRNSAAHYVELGRGKVKISDAQIAIMPLSDQIADVYTQSQSSGLEPETNVR